MNDMICILIELHRDLKEVRKSQKEPEIHPDLWEIADQIEQAIGISETTASLEDSLTEHLRNISEAIRISEAEGWNYKNIYGEFCENISKAQDLTNSLLRVVISGRAGEVTTKELRYICLNLLEQEVA